MRLNSVILAVEDRLSDAVATKILDHFGIKIKRKTGYKGILIFNKKHRVSTKPRMKNAVFLC